MGESNYKPIREQGQGGGLGVGCGAREPQIIGNFLGPSEDFGIDSGPGVSKAMGLALFAAWSPHHHSAPSMGF